MIRLSILIPSIPSRFDKAIVLYKRVLDMVGDKDIEVLMLTDNKKLTIGAKRDALKNICSGKYFMFVDDDDDIVSIDELYEAALNDVDVITFKQKCRNADGTDFIVTFGLGNEVEHNTDGERYLDCKRPPFHVCAWNKKYNNISFANESYAEDWEFVRRCLDLAKTEIHIDKILHLYNFDPAVTEADASSNSVWQNPNHEE